MSDEEETDDDINFWKMSKLRNMKKMVPLIYIYMICINDIYSIFWVKI